MKELEGRVTPHRIVVTGAESTGKTIVARHLADYFQCPLVPEQLRLLVDELERQPVKSDSMELVERFRAASASAIEKADRLVIFDTDLISTAIYHNYYFDATPEYLDEAAAGALGDFYLLMNDDIPWIEDEGQRDGVSIRKELQPRFVQRLTDYELQHEVISGDYVERIDRAVEAVTEYLELSASR